MTESTRRRAGMPTTSAQATWPAPVWWLRRMTADVTILSSAARPDDWPRERWVDLPRDDAAERHATTTRRRHVHWAPLQHKGYRDAHADDLGLGRRAATLRPSSPTSPSRSRCSCASSACRSRPSSSRATAATASTSSATTAPRRCSRPGRARRTIVGGWQSRWDAKTTWLGSFSRFDGRPPVARARGAPGGARLGRRRHRRDRGPDRRGAGSDGGSGRGRCAATSVADELWRSLQAADVVVGHAGQNVVSEVAAARRACGHHRPAPAARRAALHRGRTQRARHGPGARRLARCPGMAPACSSRARTDTSRWERWTDGDRGRAVRPRSSTGSPREPPHDGLIRRRPRRRPSTALLTIAHGRHDHLERPAARARGAAPRSPPTCSSWPRWTTRRSQPWSCARTPRPACPSTSSPSTSTGGGGLPLAAARNRAAERAIAAGAELLVFLDVDCIPATGLVERYREVAARCRARRPRRVVGRRALPPAAARREALHAQMDLEPSTPHPARPVPRPTARSSPPRTSGSSGRSPSPSPPTRGARRRLRRGLRRLRRRGHRLRDAAGRERTAGCGGSGAPRPTTSTTRWRPRRVATSPTSCATATASPARWGWFPMEGWLTAFADEGLITLAGRTPRWHLTAAGHRAARRP